MHESLREVKYLMDDTNTPDADGRFYNSVRRCDGRRVIDTTLAVQFTHTHPAVMHWNGGFKVCIDVVRPLYFNMALLLLSCVQERQNAMFLHTWHQRNKSTPRFLRFEGEGQLRVPGTGAID